MEPFASGRTADVYDTEDGRVLRRYRDGLSVEYEARLMRDLDVLGYPVPHVYAAHGTDLTMENVAGPTILEELVREPGQVERYGREFGELHQRLHRIAAPDWITTASGEQTVTAASVVHMDFHPGNVILGTRGPIVIDWSNATAGRPEVDVALTMVITLSVDMTELGVPALGALRHPFLRAYLQTCGADPRPGLDDAIAFRLNDRMLADSERAWIQRHGRDMLDPYVLGRV